MGGAIGSAGSAIGGGIKNLFGGGGGADSGVMQPSYMPGGGPPVTPPNPMQMPAGAIQSQMGMNPFATPDQPSSFRKGLAKAGQVATAWDQAAAKQPQQQPAQPVNFNQPAQPFIPPPQSPYGMSNSFYGG